MDFLYQKYKTEQWLPTSLKEVQERGWEQLDVILFTGDAYIDHPSFGAAVIGRILEAEGLKVGIVPQPNWQDDLRDFKKMGIPRLFFAVTGGNMDSMVNHYTANKRKRSTDAYTPGGESGKRPDYATVVYCTILKKLYPDIPLVIGGIEASLRRVTHYDYWEDRLHPSILKDSGADLLFYGMGEKSIIEYARLVQRGVNALKLTNIPQTAFLVDQNEKYATQKKWNELTLASHEECLQDKKKYAKNFMHIEEESNKVEASKLIQHIGNQQVVVNPPWPPLEEQEIDRFYDLPFTRLPHPRYKNKSAIPAYEMIRHSVNIHRGCFGGCTFCTISAHQGKFIASRSEKSILKEVEQLTMMPDFKGYISDLGGPSANMYKMKGIHEEICRKCKRPSCVFPDVCKNLNTDHQPMLDLYRKVRQHPKVKKAFIGSGIRYDMILKETGNQRV
ncbi:MAG: YgiQ family radical SAM protein, partial [Bacteroidetes bacterium GWA2_42_15]